MNQIKSHLTRLNIKYKFKMIDTQCQKTKWNSLKELKGVQPIYLFLKL